MLHWNRGRKCLLRFKYMEDVKYSTFSCLLWMLIRENWKRLYWKSFSFFFKQNQRIKRKKREKLLLKKTAKRLFPRKLINFYWFDYCFSIIYQFFVVELINRFSNIVTLFVETWLFEVCYFSSVFFSSFYNFSCYQFFSLIFWWIMSFS